MFSDSEDETSDDGAAADAAAASSAKDLSGTKTSEGAGEAVGPQETKEAKALATAFDEASEEEVAADAEEEGAAAEEEEAEEEEAEAKADDEEDKGEEEEEDEDEDEAEELNPPWLAEARCGPGAPHPPAPASYRPWR